MPAIEPRLVRLCFWEPCTRTHVSLDPCVEFALRSTKRYPSIEDLKSGECSTPSRVLAQCPVGRERRIETRITETLEAKARRARVVRPFFSMHCICSTLLHEFLLRVWSEAGRNARRAEHCSCSEYKRCRKGPVKGHRCRKTAQTGSKALLALRKVRPSWHEWCAMYVWKCLLFVVISS